MKRKTLTDEQQARWLLVRRKISHRAAIEAKHSELTAAMAVLVQAQQECERIRKTRPVREIQEYIKVYPGDPRYKKASPRFEPKHFFGEWSWTEINPK